MWAVPTLAELDRDQDSTLSHQDPKTIYYPHFHSTEVHDNYVDCLAFYGDLIISRSAKDPNGKSKTNEILLWKIDGFVSDEAPPDEPPIPSPGVYTRSSFPHALNSRGYQRLLTFEMPNTDRFYQRFSLLHAPGMRPILAMGSQLSRFLFWDLQKLEEGYDPNEEGRTKKKAGRRPKAPVSAENLNRLGELRRETSDRRDSPGTMATRESAYLLQ